MVHMGMWANTTIGVLAERPLRSLLSQASCSSPSVPRPPALNCNTLIRPTKCTPAVVEAVIALVVGGLAEAVEVLGDRGVGRRRARRERCAVRSCAAVDMICWAVSNSAGLDRWVMSPVWRISAGCSACAFTRSMVRVSVPSTSGLASLLKPMWVSLIWTNSGLPSAVARSWRGRRHGQVDGCRVRRPTARTGCRPRRRPGTSGHCDGI